MSFIAAAIIGSAAIGAISSNQASRAQQQSANQANQTQWDMYNRNRDDAEPWRTAGAGVLPQMTEGLQPGGQFNRNFTMDDFQKDPGYDFRLSEGTKAIERSRAARGGMLGGATGKAIGRYSQDYASGEYTNAFNRYMAQNDARYNRLAGLAGTGQTATNQVGNYGMNAANNISQNQIGAGNARASGYMGTANAISGAGSQWINYTSNQNLANALRGGGNFNPYYTGGTAADPAYG
jgi:hypothetical protein